MEIKQVLGILNKTVKIPEQMKTLIDKWRGVYYGISLHTLGAAPKFRSVAPEGGGRWIIPNNYMGDKYQFLFDYSLFARHQREDEPTRNWRYSQYRPLTKAPFSQITEMLVGAILQDSNYSIEIADEKDNEYIWANNFDGNDIAGYFASKGFKNMTEDPNGLFLRIPKKAYYEQRNEKVDVDIWFVNSKDIQYYTDDDLIFIKEGLERTYAYWIDRQTIWRFVKTQGQWTIDIADQEGYYAHMLGYIPVTVAGGEWNTQGYYDSYYDKAKGIADDFISTYSAAQMVDKEASHPFIETVPDECPDCQGAKQVRQTCEHNGEGHCEKCNDAGHYLAACGTCNGSGYQSVYPGRWRRIPQEQFKDGGTRIVNPDVSINAHHRTTVKDLMRMLLDALHLYNTDKSESGEAKAIDQERNYKFVSSVSNHLFDKIIFDSVRDILAMRNVSSTGIGFQPRTLPFRVTKPTQFKIRTSEDLLNDLTSANTANLPVMVRKQMAADYVDKAYNGNDIMMHKVRITNAIDTAGAYPVAQWMALRAANALTSRHMIINRELPTWMDEYISERGEQAFLNVSVNDFKMWIEPKIAEQEPPVTNIDDEI